MVATAVEGSTRLVVEHEVGARRALARLIALVACLDAAVIVVANLLAFTLKFGLANRHPDSVDWVTGIPIIDFGWMAPVWIAALALQDAYSRRQFARGSDEFKTVLRGSVLAAATIAMIAYLINYDMSREFFLLAFALGTVGLMLERCAVRIHVRRERTAGRLMHRVVVIGPEGAVAELDRVLAKQRGLGYDVAAVCQPGESPVELCRALSADTLIVVGGACATSRELQQIGWDLEDTDIDLIVVPSLVDVAGPRIRTRPVAGLPLMHIEPPQVARAMRWSKAGFDRIGAAVLILLLSPLLMGLAIAVRLETSGPAFYRHRRIGVGGKAFDVWKVRSMVVDADTHQEQLLGDSTDGVLLFKVKNDPRVTRVGAFIRRYSLDELPQLFNVLAGQMSLVGPRPQVAEEVAEYDDAAHRRLLVRPGMTGLWQVSGRSDLNWEEAVRLDLSYVDNWSMTGDLVILAKTVRAVLRASGAY